MQDGIQQLLMIQVESQKQLQKLQEELHEYKSQDKLKEDKRREDARRQLERLDEEVQLVKDVEAVLIHEQQSRQEIKKLQEDLQDQRYQERQKESLILKEVEKREVTIRNLRALQDQRGDSSTAYTDEPDYSASTTPTTKISAHQWAEARSSPGLAAMPPINLHLLEDRGLRSPRHLAKYIDSEMDDDISAFAAVGTPPLGPKASSLDDSRASTPARRNSFSTNLGKSVYRVPEELSGPNVALHSRCITDTLLPTVGSTERLGISGGRRSWTIEMWIMIPEGNSTQEHGIASAIGVSDHGYEYHRSLMMSLRAPSCGGSLLPCMSLQSDDIVGHSEVSVGMWHHLAFVYDADRREQRVILDGNLDAVSEVLRPLTGDMHLSFGHAHERAPLLGRIAEARVWTYARTPEQTMSDMGALMGGASLTRQGLAGLWKFDDTRGCTAVRIKERSISPIRR